jgi:MoaA/NifB/PqqE/SkfB family radical SAM enzyme
MFLSREEITRVFQPLERLRQRFHFYNTSAYLDFLLGKKEVPCMPWSTPTLTPRGWRRPCYLIADEHCGSYGELMEATDWGKYGMGRDQRCANCMVHCGFEASLIDRARHHLPELFRLAKK